MQLFFGKIATIAYKLVVVCPSFVGLKCLFKHGKWSPDVSFYEQENKG